MTDEQKRPSYDPNHRQKRLLAEVTELVSKLPKGAIKFGEYVLLNNDRCTGTRIEKPKAK